MEEDVVARALYTPEMAAFFNSCQLDIITETIPQPQVQRLARSQHPHRGLNPTASQSLAQNQSPSPAHYLGPIQDQDLLQYLAEHPDPAPPVSLPSPAPRTYLVERQKGTRTINIAECRVLDGFRDMGKYVSFDILVLRDIKKPSMYRAPFAQLKKLLTSLGTVRANKLTTRA